MRTAILLLLPALAFAQKWDATHDLVGRIDFEPVYAVYTQTATKRIPPSWNTKRGYLAISGKGVHFIRRRNKTEEFFVAYSDVLSAEVVSGHKILITTDEGPRYFTVPNEIVSDMVEYIAQNSAGNF